MITFNLVTFRDCIKFGKKYKELFTYHTSTLCVLYQYHTHNEYENLHTLYVVNESKERSQQCESAHVLWEVAM